MIKILRILSLISIIVQSFFCINSTNDFISTPHKIYDKYGNFHEYKIFIPNKIKKPYTLLVYFHGVISKDFKKIPGLKNYDGSPVEKTKLINLAKKHRFILLAPSPIYRYRFLNCNARGWVINKEIDGIEKLIDYYSKKYEIKNIFLAGISAGAILTHYLADKRNIYKGIISHSQGYEDGRGGVVKPKQKNIKYKVIFLYNKGDYKNIINIVEKSYKLYKRAKYPTFILRNVLPKGHQWSFYNNYKLWKLITK